MRLKLYFSDMKDKHQKEYCLHIQEEIQKKGMTYEEIAIESGLCRETISRMVNGKVNFFAPSLQKLADYLRKDVVELITGKTSEMILRDSSLIDEEKKAMREQYEKWLSDQKTMTEDAHKEIQRINIVLQEKDENIARLNETVNTNNSMINYLIEENSKKDAELSELRKELDELKSRSE